MVIKARETKFSGANLTSETNEKLTPCFTATGQVSFGEGLNIYVIWRDTADVETYEVHKGL